MFYPLQRPVADASLSRNSNEAAVHTNYSQAGLKIYKQHESTPHGEGIVLTCRFITSI
jgi:hypothetical protein